MLNPYISFQSLEIIIKVRRMHLSICFGIWTIVISVIMWRTCKTTQKGIIYVQRLHKIPCSNCVYFTGDYRLKCTVHPVKALSEEAIDCRDFELCIHSRNNLPKKNIQKKYCNCHSLNK